MAVSYERVSEELEKLMDRCHELCNVKREDKTECFCELRESLVEAAICVDRNMLKRKPNEVKNIKDTAFKCGFCPNCGNGINSEMKFCDMCGQALKWEDEE